MLNIESHFCPQDTNLLDTVEWMKRIALIKGDGGKVIFEQTDIDTPKDWSDTAVNIVVSHYFHGDPESLQREKSVGQLIHRVCRTIADWGVEDGYLGSEDGERFYGELAWLCLHQHASFNSPVWFNVGLNQQYGIQGEEHNWRWDGKEFEQPDAYEYPQSAACQPYHAKVVTEEGLLPIGDIVSQNRIGLKVHDGDGLTSIVATKMNGQKPVYKIRLRGGFEVEATADHLVCATKNRQQKTAVQWQTVDDVRPGMFMWLYPHPEGKVCPDRRFAEVLSIEAVGTQAVYDIQTASGKYLSEFVLVHNCFIQRVDDNMQSIMRLAADEAMLFKYGSGTGSSLTRLRATHEKISGGGKPSGPLSFMRIYDSVAGVVKSGGVTRRAALMHTLDDFHPDILAFIQSKQEEELKAKLLLGQGLTYQNVYETMAFQNVNISVRISDKFMQAVASDGDWETRWITDPTQAGPTYKAKELFEHLCKATWDCGDPGVQFDTTINAWHTCAGSGRICSSNPCSEFMFLDNSACNLASINLTKFYNEHGFDAQRFQNACRLLFIAQEILVGRSSYPTRRIAKRSYQYRPIGLGYTNLGSLIMLSGMAYDSDEARTLCANVTALMCGTAYLTSTELAGVMGPFEKYAENSKSMMNVIAKHWSAAQTLAENPDFGDRVQTLWLQVLRQGEKNGFRNAQATVLAPTGTISFMMDCSTTGIEPLTSLITYKKLASEGVLELVDKNLTEVLAGLGYDMEAITSICDYVTEHKEIDGAPGLRIEHLPIFDCALQANPESRCISWEGHVRMMAASQPFISGAISKTVNIPATTTPEEVGKIYKLGHQLGLKAIAVYRDRSKGIQPLSVKPQKEITVKPYRKRLPDTREAITHKFCVAGHEGFLTVGLYTDGDPGELFITMSKEGSTVGGLMDCLGISVSMGLQYGVPLESFIEKFSHVRFEPQGITTNPDMRFAKSLVDYVFRWLEQTFDAVPAIPLGEGVEEGVVMVDAKMQAGAPVCEHCGSITIRSGTCYVCKNCGHTLGCS